MIKTVLWRLLLAIPQLLGMLTLVFALSQWLPGDPVTLMLGDQATQEDQQSLRAALHLDLPLFWNGEARPSAQAPAWHKHFSPVLETRYGWFWRDLFSGSLRSYRSQRPVVEVLGERYPATLELGGLALLLALGLGIPLGTLCAQKPGGMLDRLALSISLVGVSLPSFWLGPLLMMLFAIELGWLPLSGREQPQSVILPALTLALGMAALLLRLSRASVLEVLGEDFVRTARAKGLSGRGVLFRHALRASLIPLITVVGLQAGGLLSGSVITEEIFGWPGLGRELLNAVRGRDFPMLQGCAMLLACTWVVIHLLTELIQATLDPRIRLE